MFICVSRHFTTSTSILKRRKSPQRRQKKLTLNISTNYWRWVWTQSEREAVVTNLPMCTSHRVSWDVAQRDHNSVSVGVLSHFSSCCCDVIKAADCWTRNTWRLIKDALVSSLSWGDQSVIAHKNNTEVIEFECTRLYVFLRFFTAHAVYPKGDLKLT